MLSLFLLALALSLDAFSVCLGLGMQRLRLKRIFWIGFVIGCFHLIMPFAGIVIGKILSNTLESYTQVIGGGILILIGAQMFFGAFVEEKKLLIQPIGIGLLVLALTVSIDSFSVGFGLGLSGVRTVFALLLFAVTSAMFAWIALITGRRVRHILGRYSEIFGGIILFIFGLNILFT